jgi:hypothetical protein
MGGRVASTIGRGWGMLVNNYQQRGNTVTADPEMPGHCFGLLGGLGGTFGRGNFIFGFGIFNYIY